MTKLSELFSRKGAEGVTDKPPLLQPVKNGNGNGGPIQVEDVSDVGSRIGEENEALRNLLSDAGRKIGELDELKLAFNNLVAPFNNTLRELEQEKSQGLRLSSALDELRASYEALRTEFYEVEKSSTLFKAESESLREELEIARESNRALEGANLQMSNDLLARNTEIGELERRLTQETMQRESLSEARAVLQAQFDSDERRIGELEGELGAAREKLALLEDERRSLQTTAEQSLNEVARVTRRLAENENTLTAVQAQLGKVEANYAEAHAERSQSGAALNESKERHRAEANNLNMRIEALQSRAATADRLLADARQNLIARTEEVRAFDRKAVEAAIGRSNAEKRLWQIEASHDARERHIKDIERARAELAERNGATAKTLKLRETALARAEEKIAALTERNGRLEADVQVGRSNVEKRIEDLNDALQRGQLERAVLEGALEGARKDNARLQSEVMSLRSAVRRGHVPSDTPKVPADLANREARPLFVKKIGPGPTRMDPRLKP